MSYRNHSDYFGPHVSGMRSRAEGGSGFQGGRSYQAKATANVSAPPGIVQRMNQVSLHDENVEHIDTGKNDTMTSVVGLKQQPTASFRGSKPHTIITNHSAGVASRNGHGPNADFDSRVSSANATRISAPNNEYSLRIQSRDAAKRRDSEANDTATAVGVVDGSSQRSAAADTAVTRAAWYTMQDGGESQSQSLASGGNSQSASAPTNNWGSTNSSAVNAFPPLLAAGVAYPSKVPTILQKPTPSKVAATVTEASDGRRDADRTIVVAANNSRQQQSVAGRQLYSAATGNRPTLQPVNAINDGNKQSQVVPSNNSKTQNATDAKPQNAPASGPTASTSETVAQEALANLRAFEKRRSKMRFSVSIADEAFVWDAASARDALTDNTDFLVVGVCGFHAAGKSTVASLLADPTYVRTNGDRLPFGIETTADVKQAHAKTVGIDMLVTSERTILLDTQPLLSFALVDEFETDASRRISFPYEQFVDEQSVKLLAFLFSVCHLVVVVLDGVNGESEARLVDLAKMIQLADLVRPSVELLNATPSSMVSEDLNAQKASRNAAPRRGKELPAAPQSSQSTASDQFVIPTGRDTLSNVHVAFVENKLPATAFTKRHADRMRSAIDRCFDEQLSSTLTVRSAALSMGNCALAPGFNGINASTSSGSINYFSLPRFDTNENDHANFRIPKFETFARTMRKQVLSAPIREPLAMLAGNNGVPPTSLTEKKWFEYASRCCSAIRNIRMPNFPEEFSQFVLGLGAPT